MPNLDINGNIKVNGKEVALKEEVPSKYIKDATISDDTLTITKSDNSTINFAGGSPDLDKYVTTENVDQIILGKKTFNNTLTAPIFKSDNTPASLRFSDNNEVNFGSNGPDIFFSYDASRISNDNGKVSIFHFCNGTGSAGQDSGTIRCGPIFSGSISESGTPLSDKYASKSHSHSGFTPAFSGGHTSEGVRYYKFCTIKNSSQVGTGQASASLLVSGVGNFGAPSAGTYVISMGTRGSTRMTVVEIDPPSNYASCGFGYIANSSTNTIDFYMRTTSYNYPININILQNSNPSNVEIKDFGVVSSDPGLTYVTPTSLVTTNTSQTISGAKTFSGNVTISGTLYIS